MLVCRACVWLHISMVCDQGRRACVDVCGCEQGMDAAMLAIHAHVHQALGCLAVHCTARADTHTHTHTHTHTMRVQDFPAHSHWALTDNTLFINWGVYGEYELELAPSGTVLVCLSVCLSKNSPPPAIPLPPRTTI